ncbi:hypothetical protein [Phytohabitans suffuscus]|uniref:hypothetical protein n=1 Tax=Phytohabitans suffuscus TaxID=624315 RepID=UPI0015645B9C|nr:hypothetical protein [Phytohabitans suffuscus]
MGGLPHAAAPAASRAPPRRRAPAPAATDAFAALADSGERLAAVPSRERRAAVPMASAAPRCRWRAPRRGADGERRAGRDHEGRGARAGESTRRPPKIGSCPPRRR